MKKRERAEELFLQGYNCTQAVTGAYAEEIGIDFERLMAIVSSFGGGMGRLREVCGTVSGMFFVAGALYGYHDPKDFSAKKEHYERIQYLAEKFKEHTGSIICREMLGQTGGDSNPTPSKRTEDYYKTRPCKELAGLAAEIMEEYIASHPLAGQSQGQTDRNDAKEN